MSVVKNRNTPGGLDFWSHIEKVSKEVETWPLWMRGIPGRVVHCRVETYDSYVGRPFYLGNPYSHLPGKGQFWVPTRDQAIADFRSYARWRMETDLQFRAAVLACWGKTLGCWCAPRACHATVILELAHEYHTRKNQF